MIGYLADRIHPMRLQLLSLAALPMVGILVALSRRGEQCGSLRHQPMGLIATGTLWS